MPTKKKSSEVLTPEQVIARENKLRDEGIVEGLDHAAGQLLRILLREVHQGRDRDALYVAKGLAKGYEAMTNGVKHQTEHPKHQPQQEHDQQPPF